MTRPTEPDGAPILAVTMKRALEISGLSRQTLTRANAAGLLKVMKVGRSVLVDYASLAALIDALPVRRYGRETEQADAAA